MNKFAVPKKINTIFISMALVGLAGLGAAFAVDIHRAWAATLVLGFFLTSLALAGGFFATLQFIAGATWSVVVRRIPEAMMMILPVAFLFVLAAVLFGAHDLYHWTHKEVVAADHILQQKKGYLNTTFFIIRVVAMFIVWGVIWHFYRKVSLKQDETKDAGARTTLVKISTLFIVVFAYTFTIIFSLDLVMSLEPHWYSTMFPIYTFSGAAFAGLAGIILLLTTIKKHGGLKEVNEEHLHDLGKFQFMFTVFWAYIAFSQGMLIWYANLPEETIYLEARLAGEWGLFTNAFWILHFIVPFIILIFRDVKRNFSLMNKISWYILVVAFLDVIWMVYGGIAKDTVYSNFSMQGFPVSWIEILVFFGAIGIFGFISLNTFARSNQIPIGDPNLEESIHFHQTH